MVLVDDDIYRETLKIRRGGKKLPPIYQKLSGWLKDNYNITAYNFIFREIGYNNPEHRFELFILLSSIKDYNKMFKGKSYDKKKQQEISNKFFQLAKDFNYGNTGDISNVWVCYNDFSEEIRTDVNSRAYRAIGNTLLKKYKENSLWSICPSFSGVVAFYYKDVYVKINFEKGINNSIKNEFYSELKRQDEFNAFSYNSFMMGFDSKENLDKNYQGNLYYYFK